MSGLEIAGLVLGAIPLVLKSVDAYRDGFRRIVTTFNKRQHVAKLARALRLQLHTLEELIKSIVLASGFEDVLGLDDDPISYLNNTDVQEQVEEYLGTKNTTFLIEELEANSEAVGKVARCISGLVPGLQGPKDDLVAIITANQDKPSLMADLGPRLKLVLGITDMKDMIQEIDKCSNALERFSKLALSNRQSMNSNSSRRSQKLAKAFRQIRGLAGGLYTAVLDGFRDECHDSHEARLYLDDRIDTAQRVLQRRGAARSDAPLLMFDLVFQAGGPKDDSLYYETAVQVFEDDENDDVDAAPPSNPGSAKTSVTFCVTNEDPPDSKHDVATITNICTTIKEAAGMKSRLTFALLRNRQMAIYQEENAALEAHSHSHEKYSNYVSLSQILKTTSTTLPWKPRLQLSLRLASSLLQLLQTPWLTQAWHKDAVFFLASADAARSSGPPSRARRPAPIDLSRPFVVCNFSGAESPQARPTETETRAALLELGIILLEIWHGMTLEAHFGLDEPDKSDTAQTPQPTKYFERLAQALEWEAEWTNPMPGLFGETVSQCLRGNSVSAGKKLDWEDLSVWSSICGDIIEPLSKLYKNF